MKRVAIALAFALVMLFSGVDVVAQSCTSGPSGPHYLGGGPWYYDYSKPRSCYSTYGSVSNVTACFTDGWSFGTGSQMWATYTFTVTEALTYFEAYSDVYFNDPNNSSSNAIIIDAYVAHSGGGATYTQLFSWDGTDGDLTSCPASGNTFSASAGDEVTISVVVAKQNSNATIQATVPRIFTVQ